MTKNISTPNIFSFDECLTFLNRADNECMHFIEGNIVSKLINIFDKNVIVEISQKEKGEIELNCSEKFLENAEWNEIEKYIIDWFDLNTDINKFYQFGRNKNLIENLIEKYKGLRLIGIPDLFETLCWAIAGQLINLNFAYQLKRSLVESYGKSKKHKNKTYWNFPKVETIAKLSSADFRKMKFTQKKGEYIIGVAQEILKGNLSKEELQNLGYEKAKKELLKIRGIGEWTADYVLMKCCRYKNAFPIGDVGLHNALKNKMKLNNKPTMDEIRKLAIPWKGWEAYVTFYLWRSLI